MLVGRKYPGRSPRGRQLTWKLRNRHFAIFSRAWYVSARVRSFSLKLLTILLIVSPTAAFAQDPPELTLARTCFVEGGFSETDCAAIVGTLRNQAWWLAGGKRRVTPAEIVDRAWAYSAIKKYSDRIRFALQLPAGDELTWNAATNRLWAKIRKVVVDVLAGRRRNPCRGATHWNARNLPREAQRAIDAVAAGKWRAITCTLETKNAFYTVVR